MFRNSESCQAVCLWWHEHLEGRIMFFAFATEGNGRMADYLQFVSFETDDWR